MTNRTAPNIGYRFHHVSNGATSSPNLGLNASLPFVGFPFFFLIERRRDDGLEFFTTFDRRCSHHEHWSGNRLFPSNRTGFSHKHRTAYQCDGGQRYTDACAARYEPLKCSSIAPPAILERQVLGAIETTRLFSQHYYQSGNTQPPAGQTRVTMRPSIDNLVEPHAGPAA